MQKEEEGERDNYEKEEECVQVEEKKEDRKGEEQ